MSIDDKSSNSNDYECSFCSTVFNSKKTLTDHLKSSKRCLSKRPILNINCIWCNTSFITKDDLNKHYKKCSADKETIYTITLEQNRQFQEKVKLLEKQNKDLQEKLFTIANKPTNTTNIKTITCYI